MYGHTGPHLGRKGDRPSSRELADIQGQTEALRHFLSGAPGRGSSHKEPATQWPRESRVEMAGWCVRRREALGRAQSILQHLKHDRRQPKLLHTRRRQAVHQEREREREKKHGKEPK